MDINKKDEQGNPIPFLPTDGQSENMVNNTGSNKMSPEPPAATAADETTAQPANESVSATEVPEFVDTNIVVDAECTRHTEPVSVNPSQYEESLPATTEPETAISTVDGDTIPLSSASCSGDEPLLPTIDPAATAVVDGDVDSAIQTPTTPVLFPASFTPFYQIGNAVYGTISIEDCFRAPEHAAMFDYTEESDAWGIIESYKKIGRLKPVFGILRIVHDKPMCAVIDGNRYVELAKEIGIPKVFVCIITASEQDVVTKIMAQLQFSNHSTYMALFKIIQNLWPVHYKGQGYRSDLDEKESEEQFDEEKPYGNTTRRLTIYQKIGKDIGLSGNAVKFIRKIGMVNDLHFKQIETTRHSLYAAYLACKNHEDGNEPAPPQAKAPTFIRTSTVNPEFEEAAPNTAPEFSAPTTTVVAAPEVNSPVDNPQIPIATSIAPDADDAEFIIARGVCECCNQETNIRIPKALLK